MEDIAGLALFDRTELALLRCCAHNISKFKCYDFHKLQTTTAHLQSRLLTITAPCSLRSTNKTRLWTGRQVSKPIFVLRSRFTVFSDLATWLLVRNVFRDFPSLPTTPSRASIQDYCSSRASRHPLNLHQADPLWRQEDRHLNLQVQVQSSAPHLSAT